MPYKDPERQKQAQRECYNKRKKHYQDKQKEIRQRKREWFDNIKTHSGCIKCGEKHPACLSFHHRNPNEKKFKVGDGIHLYGKDILLQEIAKCDVLCENCHRKLHYGEYCG